MLQNLRSNDLNYPTKVKSRLSNAPVITVLGDASLLSNVGIAIIGSRSSSTYSHNTVAAFVESFAQKKINIISGLAPGVDYTAHTTALAHGCPTIGVLGFGVNYLKSFENYDLVKQIVQYGGCVVSPFKSDQKPEKFTFVERNKLISALASALIVIEATMRSGTFYTVQSAVEFDIPVFAVPGSIFSKNSKGTHSLIKSGAYLADTPQDVLASINFDKPSL